MRRSSLVVLMTFAISLVVASGAHAVVVNDGGTTAGVALIPSTRGESLPPGVSAVPSSGGCSDPWLSSDLGGPVLPSNGLCWHRGAVLNSNETFDLAWDPLRRDWATTRDYVEAFLRDVADGSGTLTSPYAVTTQYEGSTGRAANDSRYGGGCIDYGNTGGSTCQFGNVSGTGAGHDYLSNGCPVSGTNQFHEELSGGWDSAPNDICLTDAQLRNELATTIVQQGILGHNEPGYAPLLVLMTPPGVDVCLDAGGHLCSANGGLTPPPPTVTSTTTGGTIPAGAYVVEITYVTAAGESMPSAPQTVTTTGSTSAITITSPPAATGATGWYAYVAEGPASYVRQHATPMTIGTSLTLGAVTTDGPAPQGPGGFCSYHSQVDVGGTEVSYVVQPWTALTGCDEPGLPSIPKNLTAQAFATDVGERLVSPLSQAQIAAIVNPGLNGWSASDGAEINDNGCVPLDGSLDSVTVGGSSQNPYLLQREFNNGGVIETDPNAPPCAASVALAPTFVVPSAVNQGDVIEFDGSKTVSSLIVPSGKYLWTFGDGKTAVGPSVVHTYAKGGTYTVTLTVTDRGGNVRSLSQTISVLGPTGQPVSSTKSNPGLHARIQLMPQSLRAVLREGVAMQLSSNEAAAGVATLSIPRRAARRAHIATGRGATVVIGRGTISRISAGTSDLRLRLSRVSAAKLARVGHTALTIRLALVAAGGDHLSIVAAGRY